MSVSQTIRAQIRARANYACEYCGISEIETGGELTVDHYQPQAGNGGDEPSNLVYACYRCNLYKGDYWADDETVVHVWNPRSEPFDEHLWIAGHGNIYGLTEVGRFTIKRLRLNRVALVAHRRAKLEQDVARELFEQTQTIAQSLTQTNEQQRRLLEEQQKLLEKQQTLLRILLNSEQ